jgi:hypothetical protein
MTEFDALMAEGSPATIYCTGFLLKRMQGEGSSHQYLPMQFLFAPWFGDNAFTTHMVGSWCCTSLDLGETEDGLLNLFESKCEFGAGRIYNKI